MPATDNGKDPTMAILKQHLNEQINRLFFLDSFFSLWLCFDVWRVLGKREGWERGDLLECFHLKR